MRSDPALLFTVEHGDNKVPAEYADLFSGEESVLSSHRGHDPGAGELAVRFSTRFHAPCEHAEITRLLIDQNRSIHNRRALFSEYTRHLPDETKNRIIDRYYRPYQEAVRQRASEMLARGATLLPLAIHSFTPELNGAIRHCDVSLMYDPARETEKVAGRSWQEHLVRLDPSIRVRRNYPYRGASDGIVQALRRQFAGERFVGLQLEVNQTHVFGDREEWKRLQKMIVESFARVIEEWQEIG